MGIETVGDLIEALSDYGAHVPVRVVVRGEDRDTYSGICVDYESVDDTGTVVLEGL